MKNYDKNTKSSYIMYLDANNLYGWEMSQKLPVDGFKWVKNLSKFNECFIKDYDENSKNIKSNYFQCYLQECYLGEKKKIMNFLVSLKFLFQTHDS